MTLVDLTCGLQVCCVISSASFTVILLFEWHRMTSIVELGQVVSHLFLTMVNTVHYPSLRKCRRKMVFRRATRLNIMNWSNYKTPNVLKVKSIFRKRCHGFEQWQHVMLISDTFINRHITVTSYFIVILHHEKYNRFASHKSDLDYHRPKHDFKRG